MPRYGEAFYGTDYYGRDIFSRTSTVDISVDLKVNVHRDPATDKISVGISWPPRGNTTHMSDKFALVRSRFGYATLVGEGDTIFAGDHTSTTQFVDANPSLGEWNYYTVWYEQESTSKWFRLGVATINAPSITEAKFWRYTPQFYKDADTTHYLEDYLSVLDFGFDLVRSQQRSRWDILVTTNLEDFIRHAGMFGIPLVPISPRRFRSLVAAWPYIVRARGSDLGLEMLVRAVTGSDLEIGTLDGYNLMLNEDQASFAHPIVKEWDAHTYWMTGEKVTVDKLVYGCVVPNRNSRPSSLNTKWQTYTSFEDTKTLYNFETETISTWDFSRVDVTPVGGSPVNNPYVREGLKTLGPVRIDVGPDVSADPTASVGNCYTILINPYEDGSVQSAYTGGDFLELRSIPSPNNVLHAPGDPHAGDHGGNHDAQEPEWGNLDYARGHGIPVQSGQYYLFSGYLRRFRGVTTYAGLPYNPVTNPEGWEEYSELPQEFPVYKDVVAESDDRVTLVPWVEYCSFTGEPVARYHSSSLDTQDNLLGFSPEILKPQSNWTRFWILTQSPKTAADNAPMYLNVGLFIGNVAHSERLYMDLIQVEKIDPYTSALLLVEGTQDFSWYSTSGLGGVEFESSTQEFTWGTTKPPPPPPPDYLAQASNSGTWRPAVASPTPYTWRGDEHVFQGDGRIQGYQTGNMIGYFWYPTLFWTNLKAALDAGWVLKKMSIFLYRPIVNGRNQDDPIYMGWHPYSAKPSLAAKQQPVLYDLTQVGTLRWSEAKWIHVPSTWYANLSRIAKTPGSGNPWNATGFGFGFHAAAGRPFVQITGYLGDTGPTVPYLMAAPATASPTAGTQAPASTHIDYVDLPIGDTPPPRPTLRHPGDPNSGNVFVEFWARE